MINRSSYDKEDSYWQSSIAKNWDRLTIEKSLEDLNDYLVLQSLDQQGPYKLSYLLKDSARL